MPRDEAFFSLLQFQGGGGGGKNRKYAFSLRVLSMILAGYGLVANVLRPMLWGLFGLRKIKVRFTLQVGRLQPDLQSVFKGLMTKCNNRYW